MHFIAECGIERSALPLATNGTQERLPNRNPIFFQFPRLPLYKEILRILTKLRKVESKTKEFILFLPRGSKFAIFDGKVTKKREQNKINNFIFYAECSNFAMKWLSYEKVWRNLADNMQKIVFLLHFPHFFRIFARILSFSLYKGSLGD